jgi:hypothetical protein
MPDTTAASHRESHDTASSRSASRSPKPTSDAAGTIALGSHWAHIGLTRSLKGKIATAQPRMKSLVSMSFRGGPNVTPCERDARSTR